MVKTFFSAVKRYKINFTRFVLLYILFAAAGTISNIVSIRATGDMTQAAGMGVTDEMMRFLLILAVSGIITTLAQGVQTLFQLRFYGKTIHSVRHFFAEWLLFAPYREFAGKNSGEGVSLFTSDIKQTASFVTVHVLSQISQLISLLVSVVFMLYINWWLTLSYFALFPLLAALQAKLSVPIGKKSLTASEKRAAFNAVVSDALQNPLTVMAYGLEESVERRFDNSYMEYFKAMYENAFNHAILALAGIVATLMPAFALYMASGALVIHGSMTIAGFIALTIIAGPAMQWVMMFAQDMARMQQTSASAKRVLEFQPDTGPYPMQILSASSTVQRSQNETERNQRNISLQASNNQALVFQNVDFNYTEEPKTRLFENISFTVEKGSLTALAGPSGCGKSTALKLILGLYPPSSGGIFLLSDKITYVPQDCHLLPISIKDNIICAMACEEEKLHTACKNAGIYEFITGLPEGFDSILTESAANISGGQKQRIAMARAFYQDADLLLLDEATSALDPATETVVLEAFCRYVRENNKTALMVAHRPSVLDMAGQVITFGEGAPV